MKRLCYATAFLIIGSALNGYDNFGAEIFVQGDEDNVIYYYDGLSEESGSEETLSHTYTDASGSLFASEIVTVNNEGAFVSHETNFPQLGESSLLLPGEKKWEIFFERDGKKKSKTINVPDDLIFGPTQQDLIIENLENIKGGGKLSFSLPVPEFLTTMRFTMKEAQGSEYEKEGTVVVEMKSNNILLWFIAKPIYYVLDDSTGVIKEIHGPTILKRKVGDKWDFFDADIYFRYES